MTKNDLVAEISEDLRLRQVDVKRVVQLALDGIVATLAREKRIELRNFGIFEVRVRAARRARNPLTNAIVEVPAKNVISFKPGKLMKEKIR